MLGSPAKIFQNLSVSATCCIFDPGSVTDNATYLDSCVPSSGVRHLLVNGTFVVRDGDMQVDAYPGLPVRGQPR